MKNSKELYKDYIIFLYQQMSMDLGNKYFYLDLIKKTEEDFNNNIDFIGVDNDD